MEDKDIIKYNIIKRKLIEEGKVKSIITETSESVKKTFEESSKAIEAAKFINELSKNGCIPYFSDFGIQRSLI